MAKKPAPERLCPFTLEYMGNVYIGGPYPVTLDSLQDSRMSEEDVATINYYLEEAFIAGQNSEKQRVRGVLGL